VERHHDWEQNLAALDNLLAEGCDEPTAADEDLRSPSHANEINFTPEKSTAKPSSVGALQ
jgi:hypothetical protein